MRTIAKTHDGLSYVEVLPAGTRTWTDNIQNIQAKIEAAIEHLFELLHI